MYPDRKYAYEWILIPVKGEELILTENQYDVYKNQIKAGNYNRIFFEDFEVNPSYITSAVKKPAKHIKRKYPCLKCKSLGVLTNEYEDGRYKLCPNCKGTGVDYSNYVLLND